MAAAAGVKKRECKSRDAYRARLPIDPGRASVADLIAAVEEAGYQVPEEPLEQAEEKRSRRPAEPLRGRRCVRAAGAGAGMMERPPRPRSCLLDAAGDVLQRAALLPRRVDGAAARLGQYEYADRPRHGRGVLVFVMGRVASSGMRCLFRSCGGDYRAGAGGAHAGGEGARQDFGRDPAADSSGTGHGTRAARRLLESRGADSGR